MQTHSEPPLIVAFVADLMFTARIERVAHQLGYRLELVETLTQMVPGLEAPPADQQVPASEQAPDSEQTPVSEQAPAFEQTLSRQLGEHLSGPGAVLIDLLSAWGPALLIFDLNNPAIPWRNWIPMLTSVPATRHFPVLCFGSHVDVEATQAARAAGATAVVARSRFTSALPELMQKYVRLPDQDRLVQACDQPLSPLALSGLEEFNKGEYFEAHELLELAWNEDSSPARELYRAVLQVGVAYLQIERGNYPGALKMFLRLRQWIDPLPALCRGIDVAGLREDARQVHQALLALGPDGIAAFDRSLFKPVRYNRPAGLASLQT
jgi:predicted metal-dependent hydrolase